jgi:hypothetical protein
MDEKVSLSEMCRRWEALLERKRQSDELERPFSIPRTGGIDLFDCTDCAVPTVEGLVEDAVAEAIDEWRSLDDRKIPEGEAPDSTEQGPAKKKPKWYNMHVRLPPSFDYKATQGPPEDDGGGDRVLQLDNPTKTLSYHRELWKIFASLPTRAALQEEALEGLSSPEMSRLRDEWLMLEKPPNVRLDKIISTRLRLSSRQGAHETAFSPPTAKIKGTLFFEIWKGSVRHLQTSSTASDERAVLEFRGDQTLLDFHNALCEISMDLFWDEVVQKEANGDPLSERSGMFLIEDKIYTCGKVDYSDPVISWFKQNNRRILYNLGYSSVTVHTMVDTRLEDIPMRLNLRYFHMHSGTVTSQVFLTDRRHGYPRQPAIVQNYPIVHDVRNDLDQIRLSVHIL